MIGEKSGQNLQMDKTAIKWSWKVGYAWRKGEEVDSINHHTPHGPECEPPRSNAAYGHVHWHLSGSDNKAKRTQCRSQEEEE